MGLQPKIPRKKNFLDLNQYQATCPLVDQTSQSVLGFHLIENKKFFT
jgi:hypothetical protein